MDTGKSSDELLCKKCKIYKRNVRFLCCKEAVLCLACFCNSRSMKCQNCEKVSVKVEILNNEKEWEWL